ncbi:hypothetical protein [Microbacterium sp. SA39]|uniref:hypothetical protein n=1 Tax=Microbacterium sp. SA39 TaxID=1263625 RepID=UPI0005FA1050|nr:hypothetical protein [Microbacterium sp. SA39]KJQ53309.1 hypothetical protein RS85_02823 [Microbacterium sp. SA39]
MDSLKPYFGVFWGARAQTFGEFADQTRDFLLGLRSIHPAFATLYVLGDKAGDEEKLGDDLENLDALTRERGWNRSSPRAWFSVLDPDGYPTRETVVDVGWSLSIVNQPEGAKTRDFVSIAITSGQSGRRVHRNRVLLMVDDGSSALVAPAVAERVFRYLIEFWQAERGWLTEEGFRSAVWDESTREQLGWLNFRDDPAFARFLPSDTPLEPYREGIIFRIGDGDVLSSGDQAAVATGRAIQDAVRAERSET